MTKANEILIDLCLKYMLINRPFYIHSWLFDKVLKEIEKNTNFDETLKREIHQLTIRNDETVRPFLLQNGYITSLDHSTHKDISTEKGQKAQELGGHKQYLEYERKLKRQNNITNLPSKYWYIVMTITGLIGYFADIYKEKVKHLLNVEETKEIHRDTLILRLPTDTVFLPMKDYLDYSQKEQAKNAKSNHEKNETKYDTTK